MFQFYYLLCHLDYSNLNPKQKIQHVFKHLMQQFNTKKYFNYVNMETKDVLKGNISFIHATVL